MLIISIALIFDLIIFGFLLSYFFNIGLFFEERIAWGGVLGLLMMGFGMFFLGHFLGLSPVSLGIFLLAINAVSFLNLNKTNTEKIIEDFSDFKRRLKTRDWIIFYSAVGFFIFVFGYLASQLLIFEKNSFFVQPSHAYGDISQHLGIISSFAFGNNFPPQSSILAGEKISYPFLVDFITAVFINPLSLRYDFAISLTGVTFMIFLIVILSFFVYRLTESRLTAILVLFLFFFSGGLGFVYYFNDFQNSGVNFFDFISHLPRDYTALNNLNYFWINVVLMMLLPQRSFLIGLPVFLIIFSIFWDLKVHFDIKKFIFGIFLTSLLPLIHTHSLVAISPFLIWLTIIILKKNPHKSRIILLTGFFAFLLMLFLGSLYLNQVETITHFFRIQIGWMAQRENILQFYFKNFGPVLILVPISIYLGLKRNLNLSIIVLIAQIWFILPSIFVFQPWDFDNNKLFIYWYLISIILVAYIFRECLYSNKTYLISASALLILFMTCSGILDIMRLLTSSGTRFEVYSPQAIKMANFVIKNTPQKAVFLSTDKFDNPVVALSGRSTLVGYRAWLWSYGLDYAKREEDIEKMFSGEGDDLFQKYGVTNVILFPDKADYKIDRQYFDKGFKLIYEKDGYRVYKT